MQEVVCKGAYRLKLWMVELCHIHGASLIYDFITIEISVMNFNSFFFIVMSLCVSYFAFLRMNNTIWIVK